MSRKPITMPALSDTMETGRLVSWLKKPGDAVKKGDVIAEVESDKAIMEVEAFEDGYLAGPLAEPDSELPVGAVIGYLADTPEQPAGEEKPVQEPASPASEQAAAGRGAVAVVEQEPALPPRPVLSREERDHGKRISPYARALARELGIDPGRLRPGADGTVRSAQVVAAALQGPGPDLEAGPPWQLQPLTTMQRAVAEGMSATVHTPVFRVSASLPLAELKQLAREQELSLTLLLARACALTVKEHPRFNALYTPEGLAQREQVDVGVAVDLPDGLVTPVLRDVARRPLGELAEEWRQLKEKVASRRLALDDYRGATFYLSNLGTFPVVKRFDAIVPLGAAAILAIGAAQEGSAEFTLGCDHRVVYGGDAARFLQRLSELLESPASLLH